MNNSIVLGFLYEFLCHKILLTDDIICEPFLLHKYRDLHLISTTVIKLEHIQIKIPKLHFIPKSRKYLPTALALNQFLTP